jgi:hypothetical protein
LSRGDEMEPASSAPPLSGFDAFLANNLSLLIIIVGCCCSLVPLGLGIVGLIVAKDPTAKRNAMILTIAGVAFIVINIIVFAVRGTADLNVK